MDDGFLHWLMGDTFGLEDTSLDVPAWMAAAACAGADPSAWFPGKGGSYGDAAAVCDDCPVREACLDHALALEGNAPGNHRVGMWGGLTPKERARLAQQAA